MSFLPGPWFTEQARRWWGVGIFEHIAHDLCEVARAAQGKDATPTATILDGRVLQSTSESGSRRGCDGGKRKKGSKVHIAIDTLGHLPALHVPAANEQERAQVSRLCSAAQDVTGESIEVGYVDQGDTGENAENAAAQQGVELRVVKLPDAKKGFVLLPKRWAVERTSAWLGRSPATGPGLRTPDGSSRRLALGGDGRSAAQIHATRQLEKFITGS